MNKSMDELESNSGVEGKWHQSEPYLKAGILDSGNAKHLTLEKAENCYWKQEISLLDLFFFFPSVKIQYITALLG